MTVYLTLKPTQLVFIEEKWNFPVMKPYWFPSNETLLISQ